MPRIETRNILTCTSGIICHQVNLQGKMGAGLALKIRNKWPDVYRDYMKTVGLAKLGDVVYTNVGPTLWVASMFGQATIGRIGQHTDVRALGWCFNDVAERCVYPIQVPFGIGCGLGGANWSQVLRVIELACPQAIICKLPEAK